jgi:hypothetical protein
MLARPAAILLVALSIAPPAWADGAAVGLRYEVAASCPSSDAFEASVHRLGARVAFRREGALASTVDVSVARRGATFVGSLVLGDGPARVVEGATCAEVVDALALITSLAMDATPAPVLVVSAATSPAAPVAAVPPPPPLLVPLSPLTLSTPMATPPPAPRPVAPAEPRPSDRAGPRPWHVDVDSAATLRTGVAPVSMLGVRAGAALTREADGLFAPQLGLAVVYATSSPYDAASPDATFKLAAAQLTACPMGVTKGELTAYACVASDLGAVMGQGESADVASVAHAARFWADLVVGPRARVRVAGPVFAQLDADAAFSLVRPSFELDAPVRPIHTVATVGFAGSLGLGVAIR